MKRLQVATFSPLLAFASAPAFLTTAHASLSQALTATLNMTVPTSLPLLPTDWWLIIIGFAIGLSIAAAVSRRSRKASKPGLSEAATPHPP